MRRIFFIEQESITGSCKGFFSFFGRTVPSSLCEKLPMTKSAAPRSRTTRSTNWRRMTHLTPAKLISVKRTMTIAAMARSISGEWDSEMRPAMDSPKPVAQRALPIA